MAKNIFAVRENANDIDGACFYTRETSPQMQEKLERFGQDADRFASEAVGSGSIVRRMALFRILLPLLGFVLLLVGYSQGEENASLWSRISASPWMFVGSLICFLAAIGLIVYERVRASRAQQSDVAQELRDRSATLDAEAYAELGVPADAVSMDLLAPFYTVKNGNEKILHHTAFAFRAFVENGNLCLADVQDLAVIPLEAIGEMTRIERSFPFYFWNKTESPRSDAYRRYRIRTTGTGGYAVKGVYTVHIHSDFGEYEILVPPYEMETFLRLTGKTAPSDLSAQV